MSAPTLAFSKNFSAGQRNRAMARYAAVIRFLQKDPANITRIHGTTTGGMARYGLMTNTTPRRLTPFALEWIAAYSGPVAPLDDVTTWGSPTPVRKPAPQSNPIVSILTQMVAAPHTWIHVHAPAIDALTPEAFWLLCWLQRHRECVTLSDIALEVGWAHDVVAGRLAQIAAAGYAVPVVLHAVGD